MTPDSDSTDFWHRLAQRSSGLVEPCTLPSPLPDVATPHEVHDLLRGIAQASDRDRAQALRVYFNGARRKGNYERVFLEAISRGGSLLARLEELCSSEFLAFVNLAGSWSEPIARRFARLAAPLVVRHPPSSLSLELHVIIGRYAFTPFGIHLDEPNDRVLHFNIGPGTKTLYLWDKDVYQKCHGDQSRCFDPAPLLPSAAAYPIRPDQTVFHLPAERFHVGTSPELSITMCLALSKRSRRDFVRDVGKRMTQLMERRFGADVSFADFSPEAVDVTGELAAAAWPEATAGWITEAAEDARLLAASNLSFTDLPSLARVTQEQVHHGALVRLADPFPILTATRGEELSLFMRGRAVRMRRTAAVVSFVEQLMEAGELPMERALSVLTRDLATDAALGLLRLLASHRAVDLLYGASA